MNNTTWNNYLAKTWNRYLPPIRPYYEELSIFKKYIKGFIESNSKKPNILILGSTPELRDIVYEYDIIPTVVDFSKENYEGMGLLRRLTGKDIFIEKNWLELSSNDGDFDFIFSEAAFNVLPKDSAKQLYKKSCNLLKKNGKIVAKEWVRFSDQPIPVDCLIKKYRISESALGFYAYVCIPLMLNYYDFEKDKIILKEFDNRVRELFYKRYISEREYETISVHEYQKVELELYIPLINKFMNDMNNFASLINVHNVNIAHSEYHPIFVYERI